MATIIGKPLPNIPWQDRPAGSCEPIWRYTENPVITRAAVKDANSIFNAAVIPFRDGFAGVFRVDDVTRSQYLVLGKSDDGIHWQLEDKTLYPGYDPRVCEIDGLYCLSWVAPTPTGTTIGIAVSEDFEHWERKEDAVLPVPDGGHAPVRRFAEELASAHGQVTALRLVVLVRPGRDGRMADAVIVVRVVVGGRAGVLEIVPRLPEDAVLHRGPVAVDVDAAPARAEGRLGCRGAPVVGEVEAADRGVDRIDGDGDDRGVVGGRVERRGNDDPGAPLAAPGLDRHGANRRSSAVATV